MLVALIKVDPAHKFNMFSCDYISLFYSVKNYYSDRLLCLYLILVFEANRPSLSLIKVRLIQQSIPGKPIAHIGYNEG